MHLTPKTRIAELIKTYPFLLEFLASYTPKFEKLRDPILRNTFGQIATLQMAASMGDVPLPRLLDDLRRAIVTGTGESVEVEVEGSDDGALELGRLELLKGIIRDLHAGTPMSELKERFAALLEEVSPTEIAKMEQELMAEGLPQAEVKKLCDVHVQVFKASLDGQPRSQTTPGHPVHTLLAENRALAEVAQRLRVLLEPVAATGPIAEAGAIANAVDQLAQVEKHYARKENQLFPMLEKHGVTGPPQVMWAIHDEVRALLKETRAALADGDAARLTARGATLGQTVIDMVYKEDNILLPMSLQILDEADWAAIRAAEAAIGYALVKPGGDWRPAVGQARGQPQAGAPRDAALDPLPLDTGLLALEQINLLLGSLPLDITFVDENDEVRYYSEGRERVFPRSPEIIGRKVQNCHPPKSIATVSRILAEFRAGTKDVAEFWIELGGKLVHIRYFPLRDARGNYRGTLEVTQDVTAIRGLQGQRRLLDWESA